MAELFVVVRYGWTRDRVNATYDWLQDNYPGSQIPSDYGGDETTRSRYNMGPLDAVYFFEKSPMAVAFKLRFG